MPSLRLIRLSLHTFELWGIWAIEVLNYVVHNTPWRPEPWNACSRALSYALWAIQLWCFAQLQLSDPGSVPAGWEARAKAGEMVASVCPRSGRLVPPRARFSRRAGSVVLGLDHYCYWLGTPIGFGNRKFFVLFVGYSALFCAVGALHSTYELGWGAPARLGLPTLPEAIAARERPPPTELDLSREASVPEKLSAFLAWHFAPIVAVGHAIRLWARWLLEATAAAAGAAASAGAASSAAAASSSVGTPSWLYALAVTVPLNILASLLLGAMTIHQLVLVLLNRTTLAADDARYDVSPRENWCQVFGERALLWALPMFDVADSRAGADGVHWPESTRWIALNERSAAIRAAHLAAEGQQAGKAGRAAADEPPSGLRRRQDVRVRKPAATAAADAATAAEADGRWALGRHIRRTHASLEGTYTLLRALRTAALQWERRLFCGMMTIGWLRVLLRSMGMAAQSQSARRRQREHAEALAVVVESDAIGCDDPGADASGEQKKLA